MSRRTGQSGHIEKSGKWYVVRWWMDVEGQESRVLKRARICPISGPGRLTQSERQRRAQEIITESGADTVQYFNKVVKPKHGITFREQSEIWLARIKARRRKPVANSTIENWTGCLKNWINPELGDLPLSEVNNAALKKVVSKMADANLSPKTIVNYSQVVKMVVASAIDEEGEQLFPRRWNDEFADIPVVVKDAQNTPSFTEEVMSKLAAWKKPRERMVFILCAAAGLRIGEALGLEIGKHLSPDFRTITVMQKVRHCRVEHRVKNENASRQIDLHPDIACLLKDFVGQRKSGFLFTTRNGKPLSSSSMLYRHLHPALKQMNYVNPKTGNHKAGNHAFRRFRNTHLRNRTACPEGLRKYWMGHADDSMDDRYDKIREDTAFRRMWAEKSGIGFELPPIVPMIPKAGEIITEENAA